MLGQIPAPNGLIYTVIPELNQVSFQHRFWYHTSYGTWFQLAAEGGRATRNADCPLKLRQKAARLEIRRNFFSNRVIDNWNMIASALKNARTVTSLKLSFKNHRWNLVYTT
jgi:hypothetical protein